MDKWIERVNDEIMPKNSDCRMGGKKLKEADNGNALISFKKIWS